MLSLVSPEYADGQLFNYGCTGRGDLDPRSKNVGDPVDELDREINHWKQCRRCAKNYYESKEGQTANYLFDSQKHQCGKCADEFFPWEIFLEFLFDYQSMSVIIIGLN